MEDPSETDVETEDDDPRYSRHEMTTSTNIPTPPSDRNHYGSSSPPGSQEPYMSFNSLLIHPNHNKLVLRSIPQHKTSCSTASNQNPRSHYNTREDTAEVLCSLKFPRVEAEESAYILSNKYSLTGTFEAQESGIDSTGGYGPSPPYSSIYYDTPSPRRAGSYDSDETEVIDETSDTAATISVNEQHPQTHPQPDVQDPSTRRSMRIHINQEVKNLELNMNHNSASPQRQLKSKEDAAWIAGVRQAAGSLEARAGGPPKSESKEDQQRYERNYINAWALREIQKPWTQLEQAERFVNNMRKDIFEYPRKNRESEEPGQPITKSRPSRDAPRPRRKIRSKPATQSMTSKPKPAGKRRQKKTTPIVHPREAPEEEEPKAEMGPCEPNTNPEEAWPQQESMQPRKKRRSVADNLASELGQKWEAHVDEYGHRPSRNVTKKL